MNELIRRVYSGPIIYLLTQIFINRFGSVRVFPRRSSTRKDLHFHVLFSDLDLGFEVPDTTSSQAMAEMKSLYYKIRFVFRFLGELEIYTQSEVNRLSNLLSVYLGLYDKVRDFRKINWIRNKLKDKNRNFYHRYKDHRTLKILKTRYQARSFHNIVFSIYEDLISLNSNGELIINLNSSQSNLNCNYLSQAFHWPQHETDQKRYTLVLAALPTRLRGIPALDNQLENIRNSHALVNGIFLNLNEIEFIIAQAYVRGCPKDEVWHQPWVATLKLGLSNAPIS